MGSAINLTGFRFGYLTVGQRADVKNSRTRWHVRCDCGAEKIVRGEHLVAGTTKSCGCLRLGRKRGEKAFGNVETKSLTKDQLIEVLPMLRKAIGLCTGAIVSGSPEGMTLHLKLNTGALFAALKEAHP